MSSLFLVLLKACRYLLIPVFQAAFCRKFSPFSQPVIDKTVTESDWGCQCCPLSQDSGKKRVMIPPLHDSM